MPGWLVSLLSMLAPLVPPLARWLEGRVGAAAPAGVAIEAPRVDDGDEEARRAARERAVGGVDVTPVPTGEDE